MTATQSEFARALNQVPVGIPAFGDSYLTRKRLEETALKHIQDGQSVLIVGPRRSGKTTLLRRLEERLDKKRGISTVYFDAQSGSPPRGLLRALLSSEPAIKKLSLSVKFRDWDSDQILAAYDEVIWRLEQSRWPTVIFIDEATFVEPGHMLVDLWTKIIRQLDNSRHITLVVACETHGGDDHTSMELQTAFNSFYRLEIEPWNQEEIERFLSRTFPARVVSKKERAAFSAIMAPAWPIEIMEALRAISEQPSPSLNRVEDIDNELDYWLGREMVLHAIESLTGRDGRAARRLLIALAKNTHDISVDDIADRTITINDLLPAIRALESNGVARFEQEKRRLITTTPTMAKAIERAVGDDEAAA